MSRSPATCSSSVGAFVRVYWADEGAWYSGRVTAYDQEKGWYVVYEDGDQEWETLERRQIIELNPATSSRPHEQKADESSYSEDFEQSYSEDFEAQELSSSGLRLLSELQYSESFEEESERTSSKAQASLSAYSDDFESQHSSFDSIEGKANHSFAQDLHQSNSTPQALTTPESSQKDEKASSKQQQQALSVENSEARTNFRTLDEHFVKFSCSQIFQLPQEEAPRATENVASRKLCRYKDMQIHKTTQFANASLSRLETNRLASKRERKNELDEHTLTFSGRDRMYLMKTSDECPREKTAADLETEIFTHRVPSQVMDRIRLRYLVSGDWLTPTLDEEKASVRRRPRSLSTFISTRTQALKNYVTSKKVAVLETSPSYFTNTDPFSVVAHVFSTNPARAQVQHSPSCNSSEGRKVSSSEITTLLSTSRHLHKTAQAKLHLPPSSPLSLTRLELENLVEESQHLRTWGRAFTFN